MTAHIDIRPDKLAAFADVGVTELALFGSVLRDDFGPDSDVDVLISFTKTPATVCSNWMEWSPN